MSAGDFATSRRSCEGDGQTIRALRAKGYGLQTIATMVGRSVVDVQAAISSTPTTATAPARRRANTYWTAERTAILVEVYWNQGQTAEATADAIGCTREAVVGKANRLGLKKNRPRTVRTKKFAAVHSGPILSPSKAASEPYTGSDEAYRQAMTAAVLTFPVKSTQPQKVVDALILGLRSPAHAAPVLRPIADELEARRARS